MPLPAEPSTIHERQGPAALVHSYLLNLYNADADSPLHLPLPTHVTKSVPHLMSQPDTYFLLYVKTIM